MLMVTHKPLIQMWVLPGLQGRQRVLPLSLASSTPPPREAIAMEIGKISRVI